MHTHFSTYHLLALLNWLSSNVAFEKSEEPFWQWSSPLQPKAEKLLDAFSAFPKELVQQTIEKKAFERFYGVLQGLNTYHQASYKRPANLLSPIWQEGSCQLFNYGPPPSQADTPTVLFIPSLINRSYILDLTPNTSFMRYLSTQGLRPLLIDWGEPLPEEASFTAEDYIKRICRIIKWVYEQFSITSLSLAGYCMGGIFALAAARYLPQHVQHLALFATPWNFHKLSAAKWVECPEFLTQINKLTDCLPYIPSYLIEGMFYAMNPWKVHDKFTQFGCLPEGKEKALFLAVEGWLRDGVSLTQSMAKTILNEWLQANLTFNQQWRLGDIIIDPKHLSLPVFMVAPLSDHIVPPDSSLPLCDLMPQIEVITPPCGHIGMMIGHDALKSVWKPYVEWVHKYS